MKLIVLLALLASCRHRSSDRERCDARGGQIVRENCRMVVECKTVVDRNRDTATTTCGLADHCDERCSISPEREP